MPFSSSPPPVTCPFTAQTAPPVLPLNCFTALTNCCAQKTHMTWIARMSSDQVSTCRSVPRLLIIRAQWFAAPAQKGATTSSCRMLGGFHTAPLSESLHLMSGPSWFQRTNFDSKASKKRSWCGSLTLQVSAIHGIMCTSAKKQGERVLVPWRLAGHDSGREGEPRAPSAHH